MLEQMLSKVIEQVPGLATGGILAWGMFMVYRKDVKGQSDIMTTIVKENTAAITENTAAITELTRYLCRGGDR